MPSNQQYLSNSSGCGCSTTNDPDSSSYTSDVPGLEPLELDAFKIVQGESFDHKICFISAEKPIPAIEAAANGGNGQLTFPREDHCFAVGDNVRLINNDPCTPDTSDADNVYPVASITPDPSNPAYDIVEFTGLVVEDKVYETVATSTDSYSLLGCDNTAVENSSLPPYAVKACFADVALSAYAWYGEDTFYEFNVSGDPGDKHVLSTVRGKAKTGDRFSAPALGINDAKVTAVYEQELMKGDNRVIVDRIELDQTLTNGSTCAAAVVDRGLLFRAQVRRDGNCLRIRVRGADTRSLQLDPSKKQGDYYNLGMMAIMLHWGIINQDGNLEMRSRKLASAPLHVFPGSNFA